MEQEGNTPALRWGRPQQGVSPEGKGWTEGSGKRGFMQGRRRLNSLTTLPAHPTPFYRATTNTCENLPPRVPTYAAPAPQAGLGFLSGHLGEAVPHRPGDAAQGDRLGGWHRGSPARRRWKSDPTPAGGLPAGCCSPKLSTERRARSAIPTRCLPPRAPNGPGPVPRARGSRDS